MCKFSGISVIWNKKLLIVIIDPYIIGFQLGHFQWIYKKKKLSVSWNMKCSLYTNCSCVWLRTKSGIHPSRRTVHHENVEIRWKRYQHFSKFNIGFMKSLLNHSSQIEIYISVNIVYRIYSLQKWGFSVFRTQCWIAFSSKTYSICCQHFYVCRSILQIN